MILLVSKMPLDLNLAAELKSNGSPLEVPSNCRSFPPDPVLEISRVRNRKQERKVEVMGGKESGWAADTAEEEGMNRKE